MSSKKAKSRQQIQEELDIQAALNEPPKEEKTLGKQEIKSTRLGGVIVKPKLG